MVLLALGQTELQSVRDRDTETMSDVDKLLSELLDSDEDSEVRVSA